MADDTQPDTERTPAPATGGPARPKRGAFPTPQSERDAATPYVPDLDRAGEEPAHESDRPDDPPAEESPAAGG